VAGVILFGVSVPWLVVGFTTLLQRLTPPDLQGRIYAAADTLVTTPQTISIAAGAALIGVTGYRPLLAALAAVVTLAAAYLLTRPEQRRAPDPAPNPNPAPATQAAGGSTSS
jgi:asparagine N-glycosylation enzyme membrane subunit Stt3